MSVIWNIGKNAMPTKTQHHSRGGNFLCANRKESGTGFGGVANLGISSKRKKITANAPLFGNRSYVAPGNCSVFVSDATLLYLNLIRVPVGWAGHIKCICCSKNTDFIVFSQSCIILFTNCQYTYHLNRSGFQNLQAV